MTLWEDDFTDLSNWVTTNLLSATITSGKLVTEANADTWNDYTNAAVYTPASALDDDFTIESNLEWVGRTSCLGQLYLYLVGSSGGYIYLGYGDSWGSNSGTMRGNINGTDTFDTGGEGSETVNGSYTLKIQRTSGVITLYLDDVLKLTSTTNFTEDISEIRLTNTKLTSFNGNTAKWDYVYITTPTPPPPAPEGFCNVTDVLRKAGSGASATASAETVVNNFIFQVTGLINCNSRFNFSDVYDSLNDNTKGILNETCANLAAIYVIIYDMSGYTNRIEAEDKINILRDVAIKNLQILKDKKVSDFIRGEV
jgi:hypothetical protein